ncbi:hypothetical protein ACIPRD_10510 [Streptomyces sp. NPDC090108]|uniref:hypothetical protein n=1 Tax=Streptomyces sp. NPDC090108 TaxID=3365947 RepID=UPI003801D7FC
MSACRRAFKVSFDFGFVAVESVAAALSLDEVVRLAMRVDPCHCGRLTLDASDLTRAHLTQVAASAGLTACRGLVLAALDYAHRVCGQTGPDALVEELCGQAPSAAEPPALAVLLYRVQAASRSEDGRADPRRVHEAVTWPRSARTCLPELDPFGQ